jgi:sugar (pentulose or hexulose) kinase
MKIGVDVGTTFTKAALFGPANEVVARRAAPTPLAQRGAGRFECDVDQLADTVLGLLTELAAPRVDLIAFTGQGDGLWLVDERARAVRPALSWLDARGAAVCERWIRDGVVQAVFRLTANAPFPGAGAALIASLDESDASALDAASTATQCQHVLFERLTGVRTATRSCATLPLFDPTTLAYSDEAVRLMGLARRQHLLPPIATTPAAIAPLHDELADRLGYERGTRVATGPYDLPATALGIGGLSLGDGVLILGTTLACEVLVERAPTSEPPVGLTLCLERGRLLRAMPAMVGTACIDWALGMVRHDHGELGRLLVESPPGANGVTALPYLSPAGERAPFADSAARAELHGLTLETSAADIVRAICEALAYAARQCFAAAGLRGEIVVCGGGTTSPELVQLIADVLGRPLSLRRGDEIAARGAVAAADPDAARAAPASQDVIEPIADQRYVDGYADYVNRVGIARRYGWRRREALASN